MSRHDKLGEHVASFVALLALLAGTVVAAYLPLGAFAPVVAMAIAVAKTLVVALSFMHLARRGGVVRIFAAGGLLWLALLFTLTLADYTRRGRGDAVSSWSWSEEDAPAGAPPPLPEARRGAPRRVEPEASFLERR